MKIIPGPDFPTGGIIIGKDIIKQGYNKGRGSFKIRGEIDTESLKNGKDRLIIKSIPYQVNKSTLNEHIAQLIRDKKIEGISDIRDESNREGIRVAIDLRRNVEPETIKRQLYKFTSIENSFGFNTLAIVNNKPKLLNLKDFLIHFLEFRQEVVVKKTKFDLAKAIDRAHTLLGISIAVENLDKVIKIIKNSKSPETAKDTLMDLKWKIKKTKKLINLVEDKKSKNFYKLSENQVLAILELKLQKLTALGINEIEFEIKKLSDLIIKYNYFLEKILKILNEFNDLKITVKLHPGENPHNSILIDFLKNQSNITVFQIKNPNELIKKSDLMINISPELYDSSTIMLEGLLLRKPVIQLLLDDELSKVEPLKSPIIQISEIEHFEQVISKIINDEIYRKEIIEQISNKLNDYLSFQGNSSAKFLEIIE